MSITAIEEEIEVNAAAGDVWKAIEDPVVHTHWHPFVTQINGEHRHGQLKTCTVLVRGKQGQTTERCVENDEPNRITWEIETDSTGFGRMVSGWRAGFSLTSRGPTTIVTARSSFRPRNLLVHAMLPLIRRKFHDTQRAILEALKHSVETDRTAAAPDA
jgi:hypothetical protein